MKVVEKKEPLLGMLQEEKARCLRAAKALEKEIERLPRGVLLVRSKPYRQRIYHYHYLKFREGEKSFSNHVPNAAVESLRKQLELRHRYQEEIRSYRYRIRFLDNALGWRERKMHLRVNKKKIADFCRRNGIRKLSWFGSVLTDEFRPDSDVDVLVEFEKGHEVGMIGMSALERELSLLVGRKVDLRTPAELSRFIRRRVVAESRVGYVAG